MKKTPILLSLSLVATVVLANLMVAYLDPIPVGFGLLAPAGVLAAGFAFTLRDLLQEAGGKLWVFGVILVGSLVSFIAGQLLGSTFPGGPSVARIAGAGALAFLLSELLDLAVYTPLRERNWIGAVLLSGIAGLLLDSYLFLTVAFGSLHFFGGQVVGKSWVLLLTVLLLLPVRNRTKGRHAVTA